MKGCKNPFFFFMVRNISGVYIRVGRENICFEDCDEETQEKFLDKLDKDGLKTLARHMASTLKTVCEQFDIQNGEV